MPIEPNMDILYRAVIVYDRTCVDGTMQYDLVEHIGPYNDPSQCKAQRTRWKRRNSRAKVIHTYIEKAELDWKQL